MEDSISRIPTKVLSALVSLALVFSALPAPVLAQMAEEAMGEEPAALKPVVEPESDTANPVGDVGEMGEAQVDPSTGSNLGTPEPKPEIDSSSDSSPIMLSNQDGDLAEGADGSRYAFGFVPNPKVKSIHDENETPGLSTQESLPSSYSSVGYGYITPVRDQGTFGTCTAFTAMAMAEAYMLKHNLLPGQSASGLDFSERHYAYYMYNTPPDPLGNMGDDSVQLTPTPIGSSRFGEYDSYLNHGGNCFWGGQALANWTGVAYESTAPYSDLEYYYSYYKRNGYTYSQFLDRVALSNDIAFSDVVRLSDIRMICATDTDAIKREIMDKGAANLEFYHMSDCMKETNYGSFYYNDHKRGANHDVTVVGWNDYMSRENFKRGNYGYPSVDGAWLCKNSWGSSGLNGGYFWISYDDNAMTDEDLTIISYGLEPVYKEDNQYHYDGAMNDYAYVDSGGSIASVFEAKACDNGELLDAVSFCLKDTNVDYAVQIYMDPDEGNPTSGTVMLSDPLRGKTTHEGFYKVDLPQGVRLYPGMRFAVVMTLSKQNGERVKYAVNSCDTSGDMVTIADVRPGETYEKSSAGEGWIDLAYPCEQNWYDDNGYTACLRAYSKNTDYSSDMSLDRAQVTIGDQPYTGYAVTPQVRVVLDGHTLRQNIDYFISQESSDMVSMGEKEVYVQGMGSYSGWNSASFCVLKTYPDVFPNDWYAGVVGRAAALGLINGYADGNFGPNNPITRAQVAVVLWNMAGKPYTGAGAKWFSDVQPGKYYYDAVRWASSTGVVSGYGNGLFGSADNVTREQLAVMLASFAQRVCYLNAWGSFSDFSWMYDAGQVSSWAVSSVGWCFNKGILSGSGNRIRPQGSASRAEASKMVVGLYDLVT